jgi:hypothetical protein
MIRSGRTPASARRRARWSTEGVHVGEELLLIRAVEAERTHKDGTAISAESDDDEIAGITRRLVKRT